MKNNQQNFHRKYVINQTSNCWEWKKPNKQGYGRFYVNGTSTFAHRYAYEMYKGPIPDTYVVRHLCNNPSCVNPNHLDVGTTYENMQDKVLSNRQAKGKDHGRAVLTNTQIIQIYQSSKSNYDLATQYNVTPQLISFIRSGKNWKHLTKNLINGKILNRGANTKNSKLTEAHAIEILHSSEPHHILAQRYHVHTNSIQDLRNGKTWKHLDRSNQVKADLGKNSAIAEKHGMARLTNEQVKVIKYQLLPIWTHKKIATIFGISQSTVSAISTGRVWKQI